MPVGVDEAGKGPVLGSMFAAAIWIPESDRLPDGIADSKRLSPETRASLAAELRTDDRVAVGVAEVPTARIDDPATDMNSLTVEAHAEAIDAVAGELAAANPGVADDEDTKVENASAELPVLCDACDTDADRFARRVTDACTVEVALEARHGADDDSTLVGAASVIAKVERDAHVAALAADYEPYGDLGSGYPSDPKTRAFLEAYVDDRGELPPCARESWATCEDLLAAANQTGLGDF